MRNKTVGKLFKVFIFSVIVGLLLPVNLVYTPSGATLYSRQDEAYIFLADSHEGYRMPILGYLFSGLGQFFGVATPPDNVRGAVDVLHITPSSMDRHLYSSEPHDSQDFITPFEDGLYAMCRGGTLCKWTGKSFDAATPDQQQKVGGVEHLIHGDIGDQPVHGWLTRHAYTPKQYFQTQIGPDITIVMQNHTTSSPFTWITVDLLRPGQPPEHLYDVDGRWPHFVTKSTYDRIFSSGPTQGGNANK